MLKAMVLGLTFDMFRQVSLPTTSAAHPTPRPATLTTQGNQTNSSIVHMRHVLTAPVDSWCANRTQETNAKTYELVRVAIFCLACRHDPGIFSFMGGCSNTGSGVMRHGGQLRSNFSSGPYSRYYCNFKTGKLTPQMVACFVLLGTRARASREECNLLQAGRFSNGHVGKHFFLGDVLWRPRRVS